MVLMENPVLMFEVQPTPPLSPIDDDTTAVVPQMPVHGHGEGPAGWADLYSLMSDLPDLSCSTTCDPAEAIAPLAHTVSPRCWAPEAVSQAGRVGRVAAAVARPNLKIETSSPTPAAAVALSLSPTSPPPRAGSPDSVSSDSGVPLSAGSRRPLSARIKARKTGTAGKRTRRGRSPAQSFIKREEQSLSPVPVKYPAGVLPAGHKPARGRGRQLQLATMTKEQKAAESKARLEKNRQAAREFRQRRKEHVIVLEEKLANYEVRDQQQQDEIAMLREQVARLQQQLGTR